MNHATHKEVKAAYSFYNVTGEEHSVSLVDLMADALVVAKNVSGEKTVFGKKPLMINLDTFCRRAWTSSTPSIRWRTSSS